MRRCGNVHGFFCYYIICWPIMPLLSTATVWSFCLFAQAKHYFSVELDGGCGRITLFPFPLALRNCGKGLLPPPSHAPSFLLWQELRGDSAFPKLADLTANLVTFFAFPFTSSFLLPPFFGQSLCLYLPAMLLLSPWPYHPRCLVRR